MIEYVQTDSIIRYFCCAQKDITMGKIRVAINGFGRIGRITYRAMAANENMELIAVNDLSCPATLGHLFKYDSVHGGFDGEVKWDEEHLYINGRKIRVYKEEDPGKLPWKELDIDVVIESTGLFVKKEEAIRHVTESGARKVVISAPTKGESDGVPYVVLGVNDHVINRDDVIISNSSCTTNNVAPLIMILDKLWGIEKGLCPKSIFFSSSLVNGRNGGEYVPTTWMPRNLCCNSARSNSGTPSAPPYKKCLWPFSTDRSHTANIKSGPYTRFTG